MIDLHTHILHDLDDGARTQEESIEMARLAAEDGVRIIAATPHSPESVACRAYEPSLIRHRIDDLNAALRVAGVAVEVVAGTELVNDASIVARLRSGTLLTYGSSRAILLELPYGGLPPSLDLALFNLQVAGYRVVLAHPERISDVQQDPARLIPLAERGVLMQITAAALLGTQGDRVRATAERMLGLGLAHLIASDAHGPPPRRAPLLSAARDRAAMLVGATAAAALVEDVPAALLADQPITPPIPLRRPR